MDDSGGARGIFRENKTTCQPRLRFRIPSAVRALIRGAESDEISLLLARLLFAPVAAASSALHNDSIIKELKRKMRKSVVDQSIIKKDLAGCGRARRLAPSPGPGHHPLSMSSAGKYNTLPAHPSKLSLG